MQGEQAMMAQATAPEAAPLASEREQKPAEPSMPDVPDTAVPARSAAAESGIAKDDQPKEAGSSLAPQPAQAVPTTEETPKAVPDIQADQKDGSAEPASASAAATVDVTPSGSVGKHKSPSYVHIPLIDQPCGVCAPFMHIHEQLMRSLVTSRECHFGSFSDTLPHVNHRNWCV